MALRPAAFLFVLAALAHTTWHAASAAEPCSPPRNVEVILAEDDLRFLLIGELHGTVEIPRVFGEIVCFIVTSGASVLVGIEFPESARPTFEAFVASDGATEDKARFLADSGWLSSAQSFPDGRTSEAMWNLTQRLRVLWEDGHRIAVTTFVRPRRAEDQTQTPYERGMAASLREAAAEVNYDLTLVLVGSVHALKSNVGPDRALPFEPMAIHLPRESTLSLQAVHSGGEAWNCREECGVSAWAATSDRGNVRIALGQTLSPGYDGVLAVGPISASPPVNDLR